MFYVFIQKPRGRIAKSGIGIVGWLIDDLKGWFTGMEHAASRRALTPANIAISSAGHDIAWRAMVLADAID